MKKLLLALVIIIILLFFTTGNVLFTKTIQTESEIYTQNEIEDAINTVKLYFVLNFRNCTLTEIKYVGDRQGSDNWAIQYNADESIVLISNFEVGPFADVTLVPNSTHTDWNWILVRSNNGTWRVKTYGYG